MYYVFDNGWESELFGSRELAFENFIWQVALVDSTGGDVEGVLLVDYITGEVLHQGCVNGSWN